MASNHDAPGRQSRQHGRAIPGGIPPKPRPTYEERLLEIIHENADLKRELVFLRTVRQAFEENISSLHSITQQMILNYYIRPEASGEGDLAWLDLAEELGNCTLRYADEVTRTEREWLRKHSDSRRTPV